MENFLLHDQFISVIMWGGAWEIINYSWKKGWGKQEGHNRVQDSTNRGKKVGDNILGLGAPQRGGGRIEDNI